VALTITNYTLTFSLQPVPPFWRRMTSRFLILASTPVFTLP